ncbi:MAG: cadherin-like domain-containing protein, partial [Planctomycetaceae bacterium]|nr:cadherin-like domain-containing protein [Planctomycetaceae bacterium]
LSLYISGGEYRLIARDTDSSPEINLRTTSRAATAGVWQHVVATVDYGTNSMRIFVNGVEQPMSGSPSFVQARTANTLSATASIGAQDTGGTGTFVGQLDELRIARTARTADWVAAEYAAATSSLVTVGAVEEIAGVLNNDTDAEGANLSAVLISGPAHASHFVLRANGSFEYTGELNYTGPDSFTYQAFDGTAASSTVTVNINSLNVNDAPDIATNLGLTLAEGTAGVLDATRLKVTDVESSAAGLSYTVTSSPVNGHLAFSGSLATPVTSFTQADLDTGNLRYVHNGSETTNDSFAFSVTDGDATVTGTFSIDITPVNDSPVIVTAAFAVDEGQIITLTTSHLAVTDSDHAASALTWNVTVTGGRFERTSAQGTAITSFTQAEVAAGAIRFVHDGGEVAPTVSGTVSDGSLTTAPVTFTITFNNTNDPPVLSTNAGLTVDEGANAILDGTLLRTTDVETPASGLT